MYVSFRFVVVYFLLLLGLDIWRPCLSLNGVSRYDLGIELQEVSGLCPWAKKNQNVQKHPIFKVKINNVLAWRVEIDGDDIEFITEAFSFDQKENFKICIDQISEAADYLSKVKNFNEWIGFCQSKGMELDAIDDNFRNKEICVTKDNWAPIFAPQVTIRHPLEWTIPLYVAVSMSIPKQYMQGPIINRCESFHEQQILRTMPFQGRIQKVGDIDLLYGLYFNKLLGLMFINALTMESICNSYQDDDDDDESLTDLFDSSQLNGQFDAKMNLALMSRRPFSQMYSAIGGNVVLKTLIESVNPLLDNRLNTNSTYADVFKVIMMSGDDEKKISFKLFGRANYGEQYFAEDGSPLKFSSFKEKISENLRIGQNKAFQSAYMEGLIPCTVNELYIDGLLNNGIITTTMLRNLSETSPSLQQYFKDDYYIDVLNSISDPDKYKKRLVLSANGQQVELKNIDYPYDLLSPPIFLDEKSDSMGYYKDEKYGDSALIEIRGICDIGDFFIYFIKLNPSEIKGRFLREKKDLSAHAMALLQGLNDFEHCLYSEPKKIKEMLYLFAKKDGK